MNEREWKEFLSRKGRTSRLWYKQRRECLNCGHPIIDANQMGYCHKCLKNSYAAYNRGTGQGKESEGHKTLKLIARQFLEGLGCKDIEEEARIKCGAGYVVLDIVGFMDGKSIGVECGGCLLKKLFKASTAASKVYILPYGARKPFLWRLGMGVCVSCGHKV